MTGLSQPSTWPDFIERLEAMHIKAARGVAEALFSEALKEFGDPHAVDPDEARLVIRQCFDEVNAQCGIDPDTLVASRLWLRCCWAFLARYGELIGRATLTTTAEQRQ